MIPTCIKQYTLNTCAHMGKAVKSLQLPVLQLPEKNRTISPGDLYEPNAYPQTSVMTVASQPS